MNNQPTTRTLILTLCLGILFAGQIFAQANSTCFTPGTMTVNDPQGDTTLNQHDVTSVHIAEPMFGDNSQKLVFTLKIRNMIPLPLASWNIMFVGPDNVTRFVQMSSLLGTPQFRYGRVTYLLGIPIFNYEGNVHGTFSNNGTVMFYVDKSSVGNLTNGNQITVSAKVFIKPLIDLIQVETTDSTTYTIAGNGGCLPTQIAQFGSNGDIPVSSDYNRNETDDFSVWRPSTGTWLSIDMTTGATLNFNWGSGSLGDIPVTGDFDGDGKSDFTVYRPALGTWHIWRSSDNIYVQRVFGISEDLPLSGDFDGDRIDDIAVFRPSTGVWYISRSSDGGATIAQFGVNEDVPVAGDFDGDRKDDIAVWRPATAVWYVLRSSDGGFNAVKFGIPTDTVVPGDYDGDGKNDYAVWRPETGYWYVLRSGNAAVQASQWGVSTDRVQPGDYNGNGRTDYGVWRPETGVWYVYLN